LNQSSEEEDEAAVGERRKCFRGATIYTNEPERLPQQHAWKVEAAPRHILAEKPKADCIPSDQYPLPMVGVSPSPVVFTAGLEVQYDESDGTDAVRRERRHKPYRWALGREM
jgi:hypothetical protein